MTYIEYGIVRYGAILRALAQKRTLTAKEQETLSVCESVTRRVEDRESQPPPNSPLVKSAHRP